MLQRVAGLARRPGAAFKMTVGEAVIPFEVTGDQLTDAESGKMYVLRRFDSFGVSPTAKVLGKIESYEFPDEEKGQTAPGGCRSPDCLRLEL